MNKIVLVGYLEHIPLKCYDFVGVKASGLRFVNFPSGWIVSKYAQEKMAMISLCSWLD